ncbi:hypothetical protein EV174_006743, partial [Coemansia sp. RSA 2320]
PQVAVLKAQLAIAHELGVPVSVHCVRAFGLLADVLREAAALPPRIMLHSYSGSPEMLRQLFLKGELGARVYVSFSHAVNARSPEKTRLSIKATPSSRLLVESDLHDASAAPLALSRAVDMVAEANGWEPDEACRQLAENARAFFGVLN